MLTHRSTKRNLLAVFVLLFPLLCFLSCAKPSPRRETEVFGYDATAVSEAVQDGEGTVWAIGPSGLYRWRDRSWRSAPIQGLMAVGLWKGPNGGVLVLYQHRSSSGQEFAWRKGNRTRLLIQTAPAHQPVLPRGPPGVWVGPAGSGIVMLTGSVFPRWTLLDRQRPSLFRLDMNGKLHLLWPFSVSQYLPPHISEHAAPLYWPLSVMRDADGRVWIWCNHPWQNSPTELGLQGFVVTDGKRARYYGEIPGLPSDHFTSLDVWDRNHLVAAIFKNGLFSINTNTLRARRIPDPGLGAFDFVLKVFRAGNDHYVLTSVPSFGPSLSANAPKTGVLWRLRGGHWEKVIGNANGIVGPGLATHEGFWLGTFGDGLWFVPAHGPARKIDWKQGLPIAYLHSIIRLNNGDVLATGGATYTRSVEFSPASLLKRATPLTRFFVQPSFRSLQPDRNRHLWAILPHGALGEWNGERWIHYPLPPTINPCRIGGSDVDTRGRTWLFPACCNTPTGSLTAFFDPSDQRWTVTPSYRLAVQRQRQHVQFLHPAHDPMRPLYGPHSQIAFQGPCGDINYFDGLHWRVWADRQLPGSTSFPVLPFFNKVGRLAFNTIHATTWQWNAGAGWKRVAYEPIRVFRSTSVPQYGAPPMPPAGCRSTRPSSLVVDSVGRSWWVANDALYEGTAGHCHVVLPSSSLQPFIDGRQVDRALIDARGNVFLGTSWPFSYVVLPPSVYNAQPNHNLAGHSGKPRPE